MKKKKINNLIAELQAFFQLHHTGFEVRVEGYLGSEPTEDGDKYVELVKDEEVYEDWEYLDFTRANLKKLVTEIRKTKYQTPEIEAAYLVLATWLEKYQETNSDQ